MTLHVIGFCSEAIRVLNVGTTSFCLKSFCLLTIRLLVLKKDLFQHEINVYLHYPETEIWTSTTHTHTHTHTLSLSLYTHTLSLSLSLHTLTLTLTHTHPHTYTHSHTLTHKQITHLTKTSALVTGLLHYNSSMNTMKCRKQQWNWKISAWKSFF